jgi:hypothetical protein
VFLEILARARRILTPTVDFTSRPGTGRPRVLPEKERDHVYDIVTHENPHIKMRDLLREVDDKVKKRSLQGFLRQMNLRKQVQKKRPFLTADHARARLDWANAHRL